MSTAHPTPDFALAEHLGTQVARELSGATPLPGGFRLAGTHCGIKRNRPDLGLILCEQPTSAAACVTQNPVRAACVDRTAGLIPAGTVRAIVANSGNANAMTGPAGAANDQAMAAAIAEAVGCEPGEVLTASTGVIGAPLAIDRIAEAAPALADVHESAPMDFARAILTTDTGTKVAHLSVQLPGADGPVTVQLLGVAKGSGMIHPNMATTLGFVCTDAAVAPELLQSLLRGCIDDSFNAITVDGDTSTNDQVFVLASGTSTVEVEGEAVATFQAALLAVLRDLSKQVAEDGEGATRLLEVHVNGAPSRTLARAVARSACRGSLFKSSVFSGAPEGWGRLSAAIGQAALELGVPVDLSKFSISAQGVQVVEGGVPKQVDMRRLARKLCETEVRWEVTLGDGPGEGTAWGCDLTYDYVRINADEALQVEVRPDGVVARSLTLGAYSPRLKHELLVEGLGYVRRFVGTKVVIHAHGAVTRKPELLEALSRDLELVLDAGMRPLVVVHEAEVAEQLGALLASGPHRVTPVSGPPASIGPWLDRGHLCTYLQERRDPTALIDLAIRLGAGKLLSLADAQGLHDDGGLVSVLTLDQCLAGLERGRFDSAVDENLALARQGASQRLPALHLIDGRLPHALVAELFTDAGVGTLITRLAT